MPRVLYLNDTRDHANWGSQACAQALADILDRAVPDLDLVPYAARWMVREHRQPRWGRDRRPFPITGTSRVDRLRAWPFSVTPDIVDEFDFVADRWIGGDYGPDADRYVADLRAGTDAVVFNAEGSTYRSNEAARRALFMLWLARTRFDVPALFLNGTVALTEVEAVMPGFVRRTFPVLDAVAVREPRSARNVADHVPGASCTVVPDSVFAFPPEVAAGAGPECRRLLEELSGGPYFVLSSSMLPLDFRRTRDASAIVGLVRALQELVPQAVLTGKDHGDQWLSQVAAITGARYFGPEHSYADLAALLESAAFLVSGRYHNVIFGAIVGCPAVPLTTTSPKMAGLCELLDGIDGMPYDVTDLWSGLPAIVDTARGHLAAGDERRHALRETAARLRAETSRMGELVHAATAHARPAGSQPAPGRSA